MFILMIYHEFAVLLSVSGVVFKGHSSNRCHCSVLLGMFWTEGEIQGTVHRRLLEDRAEELKIGSVLLLKQVKLTFLI